MDKNRFLIELAQSRRTDFGRVAFAGQGEEQRVFSAIWAMESEVNNGGFSQYFFNSDGETAEFAPVALRRFGADRCAKIVEEASRALTSGEVPEDQSERQRLLDGLGDEAESCFEPFDDAFYGYPDDLTDLLFEFVKAHPNVFGQIGEA